MPTISPVILSGGSGSRLWPSSRAMYPKQFLRLVSDDKTMFQETVLRLGGLQHTSKPIVVANREHRFLVAEQLKVCEVGARAIVLEPVGKNTAPAIALAALELLERGDDSVMLVMPADHIIEGCEKFQDAIEVGIIAAENGALVSFGIVPTAPHTGYGYIASGIELGSGFYSVEEFVEKPDEVTAEVFLNAGNYSWNSGIFMFRPSIYLSELEKYNPAILESCKRSRSGAIEDLDFIRVDESFFSDCPADSIDYAVMEKTSKAAVVPMSVGWSDVGSWSALWEKLEKDRDDNVLKGDVLVNDVENSLIISEKKLVAAVGVDDVVLVETDDAILLSDKKRVQDVKLLVKNLQIDGRVEAELHRKVYRPWGYYDSLESGDGFQVKRLVVHPGAQLSLQMHHHRAEHWVVVKGTAVVVNGEQEFLLGVNESTFIPAGATHQLKNPGKISLEVIEVQSGAYLEEDDIVRFDDAYGRS